MRVLYRQAKQVLTKANKIPDGIDPGGLGAELVALQRICYVDIVEARRWLAGVNLCDRISDHGGLSETLQRKLSRISIQLLVKF